MKTFHVRQCGLMKNSQREPPSHRSAVNIYPNLIVLENEYHPATASWATQHQKPNARIMKDALNLE